MTQEQINELQAYVRRGVVAQRDKDFRKSLRGKRAPLSDDLPLSCGSQLWRGLSGLNIAAKSARAIAPSPVRATAKDGDGVVTLPGIAVPARAYVPGECWYGITRAEAYDAIARTFGTPAAGHVTAPYDVPGFCIAQGEIIPVIETHPTSVNVHDVVLFASPRYLCGPSERVVQFGIGEVRQILKRLGGSFGIAPRAGRILRAQLGIDSAKMGDNGYHWIRTSKFTIPDDVRAAGHILAVLNLGAREKGRTS
jgi:hypothetical protein